MTIATKTLPLGVAIAIGVAILAGLLVSWNMVRSPATQAQALILMAIGLTVGLVAGLTTRSPWVLLLTPVSYIIAFELGRLGAVGPTVGAIRLDESYGILALVLGLGFHALVSLLPMALGVMFAHQLSSLTARSTSLLSWAPTVILAIGTAVLVVLIALPASTPPILGADAKPLPGSISSLEQIRLGDHDQWIMIHGYSVDKPVLLYLSGGPGQSDLPYSRIFFQELSRDFVVVSWDQRGTGKSYAALDPTTSLTLDQAVSDTIELTNYLRVRFDEKKIYLLGESWGSLLGVLAVQRQPDLYYAWIGSGQMVSIIETDRRNFADLLALAKRTGNSALANKMSSYGGPPYKDIPFANAFVMENYDALEIPYTPPQAYIQTGTNANIGPYGILASEYNLVDRVNVLRGLIDMFTVMYPQLQKLDFRSDVPRLDVPVYIFAGDSELTSRSEPMLEWYNQLHAPTKHIYSFADAGHSVVFEEFQSFRKIMVETILPETYPGR